MPKKREIQVERGIFDGFGTGRPTLIGVEPCCRVVVHRNLRIVQKSPTTLLHVEAERHIHAGR